MNGGDRQDKRAVYWCKDCDLPLAAPTCELCGSTDCSRLVSDLSPVFGDELQALRRVADLPSGLTGDVPLLWTNGTRYYLKGIEAFRLSYAASGIPEVLSKGSLPALHLATPTTDRPVDRLVAANRSHIEMIEHEAVEFIRHTASGLPRHKTVVAFSGGKDSMVVSYLVRKALGRSDVTHVFADTTIEAPDTYSFIGSFRQTHTHTPFVTALPHADFFEMCKLVGPPSRIKRWCCSTHKAYPLGAVYSAIGGSLPVLSFCGVRRGESSKRLNHERVHMNTKIADETMACPIIDWSDFDVWLFTLFRSLPINPGYKKGFRRIGCLLCPFNSKWSDFLTSVYYPNEAHRWQQFIESYYSSHGTPLLGATAAKRWRSRAGGIDPADGKGKIEILPCEDDESSFSVFLSGVWDERFWEYLKPFGNYRVLHDDGSVAQGVILDSCGSIVLSIRVSRLRNHARFTIHGSSGSRLLTQRLVRQMRKYQACALCGVCATTCPARAISVNGRYCIADDECTHCLRCVTNIRGGCVSWHSLAVTGRRG